MTKKLKMMLPFAVVACVTFRSSGVVTEPGAMDVLKKAIHVQGACATEEGFYLAHQFGIEKFDWSGRKTGHVDAPQHLGDIVEHGGRIYGAFVLRGEHAKKRNARGLICIWDKDLNLLKEKSFPYRFDGCTFVGDALLVGVDKFSQKPQNTVTIMRLDADLNEKDQTTVDLGYPNIYNIQTMVTDGKSLFLGIYAAKMDELDEKGRTTKWISRCSELTPDLKFVKNHDAAGFKCVWGFGTVPRSVSGVDEPVFFTADRYRGKGTVIEIRFFVQRNGEFVPFEPVSEIITKGKQQ